MPSAAAVAAASCRDAKNQVQQQLRAAKVQSYWILVLRAHLDSRAKQGGQFDSAVVNAGLFWDSEDDGKPSRDEQHSQSLALSPSVLEASPRERSNSDTTDTHPESFTK